MKLLKIVCAIFILSFTSVSLAVQNDSLPRDRWFMDNALYCYAIGLNMSKVGNDNAINLMAQYLDDEEINMYASAITEKRGKLFLDERIKVTYDRVEYMVNNGDIKLIESVMEDCSNRTFKSLRAIARNFPVE